MNASLRRAVAEDKLAHTRSQGRDTIFRNRREEAELGRSITSTRFRTKGVKTLRISKDYFSREKVAAISGFNADAVTCVRVITKGSYTNALNRIFNAVL